MRGINGWILDLHIRIMGFADAVFALPPLIL